MATPTRQGRKTSEFKAVQHHFGPIVRLLQHEPITIANEFFSKELISQEEQGDAASQRHPPHATASAIMNTIMTKIENNTKWYDTFLNVLKISSRSLEELSKEIESYRQLEEDQSYVPMIKKEDKHSIPLPPRSTLQHLGSSTSTNHTEVLSEDDSAYYESNTDVQDGDDTQPGEEDYKDTQNSPNPQPNAAYSYKTNAKCIEEQTDTSDPTKTDLATVTLPLPLSNHLECKNKMADLQKEKEILEAEIKCLQTKQDEGKQVIAEKTEELNQLQQTVNEKDITIENLKEEQVKNNEEIRRLRSEKNSMEVKLRELNENVTNEEHKMKIMKEEYQAKIDALTEKLEKAEQEMTRAHQSLEVMKKELEEARRKEELTQVEIERMNTKLVKLELKKEKEITAYKLTEQKLQSQIEKQKEKRKAEIAIKDKELAEEKLKVKELEYEKLQKKLKELEIKSN